MPDNYESLLEKGHEAIATGMVKRALTFFLDAARIDPTRPEAFEELVFALRLDGDFHKADLLSQELAQRSRPITPPYLVTAIVSVYNAERFMRHRLDNLLAQTLGDRLEIIVIDAHSPENEKGMVKPYLEKYSNITYLRLEEREGLYASWARGCRMAKGRFITNANADDVLRPDALEILAQELEAHPEAGLAYGDFWVTNRDNQNFPDHIRIGYALRPDYDPRFMRWGCYMGPQPMWRTSIHEKIGHFDPSYTTAGDYEFWCRIAAAGFTMRHVNEFLGTYQHNPSGIINTNQNATAIETQKVRDLYKDKIPDPVPQPIFDHYKFDGALPRDRHCLIVLDYSGPLASIIDTLDLLWKSSLYPYRICALDSESDPKTTQALTQSLAQGKLQFIHNAHNISDRELHSLDPQASVVIRVQTRLQSLSTNWLEMIVGILEHDARIGGLIWEADASTSRYEAIEAPSAHDPIRAYRVPLSTQQLILRISEPGFASLRGPI